MSEFLSGFYGIVIVFGPAMNRYRDEAARKFRVTPNPDHRPHITLYQAKLKDLPRGRAGDALTASYPLIGTEFRLGPITHFGGTFAFWNVVRERSLEDAWSRAQRRVAEPLLPFVDEDQPALTQGMTMADSIRQNIRRYGYALYGDSFLPHMTLAKTDRPPTAPLFHEHADTVRRIAFAELEPSDGSILELIYSTP
jgi:2'-5' RNA ligase